MPSYTGGTITIPNVTGDIVITAVAAQAEVASISAVFNQGGNVVYTIDSLDTLRQYLTVTATYSNSQTALVSAYTLSGTLTVGTSTITVSYGGKTATFTVTVTEYVAPSTSPIIAEYDKTLNSSGVAGTTSGGCYTGPYEYELPIDAFKATQYYDSANNYATADGAVWRIKYCFPNTNSVAFSSRGKTCLFDTSDVNINSKTVTFGTTEQTMLSSRQNNVYFTLSDNKVRFRFSLATADAENSYAYWTKATGTDLLPVGVSDGDIIFAGANTPYYGMSNISEASS